MKMVLMDDKTSGWCNVFQVNIKLVDTKELFEFITYFIAFICNGKVTCSQDDIIENCLISLGELCKTSSLLHGCNKMDIETCLESFYYCVFK